MYPIDFIHLRPFTSLPLSIRFLAYWHAAYCLIICLVLIGCTSLETTERNLQPLATAVPTNTLIPTPTQSLSSNPPPATLTPIPTVEPTVTPNPTPLPPLLLAIPLNWQTLAAASNNIEPTESNQSWQIIVTDNPAAELANGLVQAALINDHDDHIFQQKPIVLTVPFTMPWETISLAEAETIMNQGHANVQVMLWEDMPPTHKALSIDGRSPPPYRLSSARYLVIGSSSWL